MEWYSVQCASLFIFRVGLEQQTMKVLVATQPALFDGKHYNIGNKSSRSYIKKELTGHSGRFLHQSLSTRLIHSPGLQLTCEKTGSRVEARHVV